MSEPLKHRYSAAYVARVAAAMAAAWTPFDRAGYRRAVLGDGWEALELKHRMRRLSSTLHRFLPLPYPKQTAVLMKAAPPFGGFEGMFLPDFVEQFGLDDFDVSMRALECFTQFSSSEFAIRPFLVRAPGPTLAVMRRWTTHPSEHVRRLASEGCRPRLPWAMALPAFKRDPAPLLPILEALRGDPSDYVRRSVANNLNDLAKDHPERVLEVAGRWLGESPTTDRLVKHACRTLLKRGDARALHLFGFNPGTAVQLTGLRIDPPRVAVGGAVRLGFTVQATSRRRVPLRIEYAVHFVKSTGRTSAKVFQVIEAEFDPTEARTLERRHRFCDFTTRRHHPGWHRITILINGRAAAEGGVEVIRTRTGR